MAKREGRSATMMVGKLIRQTFSDDYATGYLLQITPKNKMLCRYEGDDPPKALKTVELILYGRTEVHDKYGKIFVFYRHRRNNK